MWCRWRIALSLIALSLIDLGRAAAPASASEPVDYQRDIKPLLQYKCAACHGALKQSAGLRLDAGRLIFAGGDSGPAVTAGDSAASLLLERVAATDVDSRMPPEGEGEPLTPAQIQLLSRWIDQGAPWPPEETVPADPAQFWSYLPPVRPAVPTTTADGWARTAVDAFIADQHRQRGLVPRAEAPREVWLRRVSLDLIGLPPTPEELRTFLADDSPAAYERVVDALLQRPEYGERWGRHWMDVWRYSDWYGNRGGNEIRYSQRHIWRWRDWIVQSLSADKPYDQMLMEMLAGDELAPDDPDVLAATGFLGRNWYKFDRDVWLFDTVEHTSQALLGLTLRCARCHDHKFEPISQRDYYRFRAFFEPHDVRTDPLAANAPREKDATLGMVLRDGVSRVFDKHPEAKTFLFRRGDSRSPDQSQPLSPGVPAVLRGAAIQIQPVALPPEAQGANTLLGEVYPSTSTGRRLALARWITGRDNPRTARVAVNHIWLRHFGQALVPTVANFGLHGQLPSHPALLDWLSMELMDHDWQTKPLHRLIVLSATYRQSSATGNDQSSRLRDPDNRFLWRMNSRRMEAEVVRDAVLFTAGTLDLARGGPEIAETDVHTVPRRSLYFRNTPNETMPLLATFDAPNPNECYRRQESVVPHQALALMNSGLVIDQGRQLAARLSGPLGQADDEAAQNAFIRAAWETILSRSPTPQEQGACLGFLREQTLLNQRAEAVAFPAAPQTARRSPSSTPFQRARENLIHVLYSHNDFVAVR